MLFGFAAMIRGPHWELIEPEPKLLASATIMAADAASPRYAGPFLQAVGIAAAGGAVAMVIAKRVRMDRELSAMRAQYGDTITLTWDARRGTYTATPAAPAPGRPPEYPGGAGPADSVFRANGLGQDYPGAADALNRATVGSP